MDDTKTQSPQTFPLMLKDADVGKMLGVSRSTWRAWLRQQRTPAPIKIGGLTLWRRDEVKAWLEAGCPGMYHWKWKPQHPTES